MSAIVCGKRSLFEDLHQSPPPVSSKRLRRTSSPIRVSPPRAHLSSSSYLIHLLSIFPDMEKQLLERALEACGNDLDSAIKSLNELRLGSCERNVGSDDNKSELGMGASIPLSTEVEHVQLRLNNSFENKLVNAASIANDGTRHNKQAEDVIKEYFGNHLSSIRMRYGGESAASAVNLQPIDSSEWVELFVREMMNASDVDDARTRAANALQVLEKSIMDRAGAEAAQNFHKENMMLQEQVELLIQENTILKRAVAIQHERQKEHEGRSEEVQQLKQLVTQYQEQLRTLEVNNYALAMHLRQAQQNNSFPGRFHPDVF